MKKVLAIGNSFSQDATVYLHQIAEAGGYENKIVDLCIGGCPLSKHYHNVTHNLAEYGYELNGRWLDGDSVSVEATLKEEDWDVITVQQVSGLSGLYGTYQPYLDGFVAYLKERAPKAEYYFHRTWAYEIDTTHGDFIRYDRNQERMFGCIVEASTKAALAIGAKILPCGDVMQVLRLTPEFYYPAGKPSLCCPDGFHMHRAYGRYLAAAVWYERIFGGDIRSNPWLPSKEVIGEYDESLFPVIKEAVHGVCSLYR